MLFDNRLSRKILIVLVILTPLLYLLPLGFRPLMTPDETRYAEIPREILVHGDWVLPHLGGLRYFEKPEMGYWLGAISQFLFGANNFAVRLPSALATMLTALMLYFAVRRFKGKQTAILTTIVFLLCGLVYFVGTFVVLDAPLSMFMTGTLLAFYLASKSRSRTKTMLWLALLGICCGAAFLTKGFIAFAVPALIIGPFMLWEKRWKDLLWMPWLPLLTAALTALPWAILVYQRDHDFWHYFVVVEHWQRFFAKDSAQHPAPFWYFIPVIIGGLMPWTLLLPGIFAKLKAKLPQDSFTRYCWCWLVFPFLFFSASSGKLGTYILPCFPAVAFLLASGLEIYFRQKDHRIFNQTVKIMAILFFTALGLLVLSQTAAELNIPQRLIEEIFHKKVPAVSLYGSGETWKWLLLTGILAISGYSMIRAKRAKSGGNKILWFCTGPLFVFLLAHPLCPWLVQKTKAPGPFLLRVADRIRPDDIVVCGNRLFAAASWYLGRDDLLVYRKGGELQYGLDKPQARGRLLREDAFARLVREPKRRRRVVLLINSRHWPEQTPEPQFKIFEPNRERILFVIYN